MRMTVAAPRKSGPAKQAAPKEVSDASSGDGSKTKKKQSVKCEVIWILFVILANSVLYFYRNNRTPTTSQGGGQQQQQQQQSFLSKNALRFVTIVMPSSVDTKRRPRRLETIDKTWGPDSHSIYVIHNFKKEYPNYSNKTGNSNNFPQFLELPSSIPAEGGGVQRLKFVMRRVSASYKADFYFFVNDHTFVIPQHLCYFLRDKDPTQDMYSGHAMMGKNDPNPFNAGAAGYILSQNTLQRLIQSWDDDDPNCVSKNQKEEPWLQTNPAMLLAKCFHQSLKVPVLDTREDRKYHQFHAYGLVRTVSGTMDDWYEAKHEGLPWKEKTSEHFDPSYAKLLKGEDCCASSTVSFHYVESFENQALYTLRQLLVEDPDISDKALENLVLQLWPNKRDQLGGYSAGLPDPSQDATNWKAFLNTLRKISLKQYEQKC